VEADGTDANGPISDLVDDLIDNLRTVLGRIAIGIGNLAFVSESENVSDSEDCVTLGGCLIAFIVQEGSAYMAAAPIRDIVDSFIICFFAFRNSSKHLFILHSSS
jgi:hypothetical protein